MKKRTKFYNFIRKIIAFFNGKYKFYGLENITEPSVIIGNHSQMSGPLVAELSFPLPKETWVAGQMINVKEIPDYAMQDFWGHRSKKFKWFYKILSKLIARPFAYCISGADVIPVYKDSRILVTFKDSVRALLDNKNLIIFPEEHSAYNEIINNFQLNFIEIAKIYFSKTGKRLPFIPMYIAPKLKKVVIGKPIYYNNELSLIENKEVISKYLMDEITSIAKSLPKHTVIPYDNVRKKQYQKSK